MDNLNFMSDDLYALFGSIGFSKSEVDMIAKKINEDLIILCFQEIAATISEEELTKFMGFVNTNPTMAKFFQYCNEHNIKFLEVSRNISQKYITEFMKTFIGKLHPNDQDTFNSKLQEILNSPEKVSVYSSFLGNGGK